jgi:hypothetical protein
MYSNRIISEAVGMDARVSVQIFISLHYLRPEKSIPDRLPGSVIGHGRTNALAEPDKSGFIYLKSGGVAYS